MDEPSTSALQYGHLGKPVYNTEIQTWEFSRTLVPCPRIKYTGVTKTTIPSPLTAPHISSIGNKSSLTTVYPELAACWPLARNETLSHSITAASAICDPLVSSLFDTGYAVDLENNDSGNRVVPIAVVASGECGNTICLRKFEEDNVEIRQKTTTWMRVPAIGQSESANWSAGGAPVRQICFARTMEEKATWMAVRLPRSTTIFRPVYHRNPVPMLVSCDDGRIIPNRSIRSRLDANPLVEISNMQTGGFAHADVTFNPWYQKQFAIVDNRGNWSIWELSGRHRRSKGNWTAACVKSGSLPWFDSGDTQDIDDHPRHDGWAAIEWAGDVNGLIVSDRRCPMLYRIHNGLVWPYMIELGLKKSEWILDVKRSLYDVSQVFILTTSRIFWLEVASISEPANSDTRTPLYPRLSWRHFRDPEDVTLRLTHLLVHEDFYLILYSRLTRLTLVFQCPPAHKDHTKTISTPDPFVLNIPLSSDDATEIQLLSSSTQFSALAFKEIRHLPSPIGKKYYDPSARLIKAFVVDSSLAVREAIFAGLSSKGASDESPPRDVLWAKKKHAVVQRMQLARSQDEFIVDDWDECVLGPGIFPAPDAGISGVTTLAIPQWTIDYTEVYAAAIGTLTLLRREGSAGPDRSFREAMKELEEIAFGTAANGRPTSQTWLEILGSSPLLEDIDQNAREFQSLLSRILNDHSSILNETQLENRRYNHASTHLAEPTNSTEGFSKMDLIATYDRLVNDWLTTMPYDIPGRTRIMKEKVIRTVAGDLILAQVSIKVQQAHGLEKVGFGSRTSPEAVLSSLVTTANDPMGASDSDVARHESLPVALLSDSGIDIRTSGAIPRNAVWHKQQGIHDQGDKKPSYASLSAFASFSNEWALPQNTESVLHHWHPGADPGGYNWQRTVQTQETEEPQPAPNVTPPRRRSLKKTPSSQGVSAPLPMSSAASVMSDVRGWGSQPDNERPAIRSQTSQAVDEDVPMTQVERGIFGGREAVRKSVVKGRKKKRAAGF
ncbi:hypothetical protein BO70DRAFT_315044 [Aspergillus heteromorphus CBS 117.55]|uniref:RNA polymerase I-specific transcription initiation factor RRN6-like protein n=1 Tax=Aspergillus heteromorphus CBS 117.55 TaxID=1448321 RepID=A0A317W5D6_9EURO|nr:uncharacterized protein BO70DRAFT_315044 [Aspergillus heteromorphus CBS 117.55]PWY81774.1 hypothetical protein BO70DRAFT_315044 [Aspergillus heteromorphus CBS 117.55]